MYNRNILSTIAILRGPGKFMRLVPGLFFFLLLGLGACNKPKPIDLPQEATIYMPQAVATRADLSVFLADTAQPFVFGAAYGGLKTPSTAITVTFVVDTNLIAAYNKANGTNFMTMPDSSYSISGLSATIPSGQTSSGPLVLSILANKLRESTAYMLPISMKTISAGQYDTSLATAYFRIDSLQYHTRDITGQGALAVSLENSNGDSSAEGSIHLVDSDFTTKFLTYSFTPGFWYQLQFPSPQVINAYTLTSGNDTPGRDSKDWTLSGSNDGMNWTTLDTQINVFFPNRLQTISFPIVNNTAYSYYRVTVQANNGDGLWQQTEWRVIQYY